MEEETRRLDLDEKPGPELQLAIATTFSVAQATDILIKQEPQDLLVPEISTEEHEEHRLEQRLEQQLELPNCYAEEEAINENLPPLAYPQVSDVIMHRAVSPPTYPTDPNEERLEKLILFYKKKHGLVDVTVELESCDKIWETLQLIKNIQGSAPKERALLDAIDSQPMSLGPHIPYEPTLGNNNKALPDFRFSIKSKKKLYHCITCGKEFNDSQHLRQHAVDEHKMFYNPTKRVYKPREQVPKSIPVIPDIDKHKIIEAEDIEPTVCPEIQSTIETAPIQSPSIENTECPISDKSKTEGIQPKINNLKEKIRCVLCKRVCTDIIYHMKNYHKVGCISSIVSQCEKITVDNTIPVMVNSKKVNTISEVIPEVEQFDLNQPLAVTVKKRKRNAPRWTIPKKKRRVAADAIVKSTKISKINHVKEGPFHCDVCLGIYKSFRTYTHHKNLHRRRGETPDNFDPSQCRFLNSPLCREKANNVSKEVVPDQEYIPVQNEIMKSHSAITDFITMQRGITESQNGNPIISEDLNIEVDNQSEQTSCECGRSFRNYHTMYLHKVKCKGSSFKNKNVNDSDSGIGISIKIKKNKNDSYEVVPQNTPVEDGYKSSKDSDASSNDSGVVSVDYNNQNTDTTDSSNITNKGHSILRIQIAEDDEEVDIEDEDSNHSNLNDCNYKALSNRQESNAAEVASCCVEKNTFQQSMNHTARSTFKKSNGVPSLINLCKQALADSKQAGQISNYGHDTSSIYFRNKTELLERVSKVKHNVTNNCPCGKNFKNLKYFNIHVRRFHPLLLNCNYCMTHFDKTETYLQHVCEVTEGKPFIEPILQTQCLKCKTLVDIGDSYDKHMKTHFTEVTNYFQCFKCELKFDNPHQRRSHFSKEHGFAYCRICSKLLHIDYLSKHEAYHDGLGHPCHLCKKAFSQKTLLKKHVQNSHDPIVNEVVKCLVCSQSIKLKYLKKHMSCHLHTEICRKCNKCYRSDQYQDLANHVALDHPYDYPSLKCETCQMTFLSEQRYKEHSQEGSCKPDKNRFANNVQSLSTN